MELLKRSFSIEIFNRGGDTALRPDDGVYGGRFQPEEWVAQLLVEGLTEAEATTLAEKARLLVLYLWEIPIPLGSRDGIQRKSTIDPTVKGSISVRIEGLTTKDKEDVRVAFEGLALSFWRGDLGGTF